MGRDDLGDIVEHQQAAIVRQGGTPGNQVDAVLVGQVAIAMQFKRLLPMVQVVFTGRVMQALKLVVHFIRKGLKPRHVAQRLAFVGGQGSAQDAGRARIGGANDAIGIEHDHPGRQVVQNRLQALPRFVGLAHAPFDRTACIQQLLRHLGKRPRETAEFVLGGQYRFGPEIAGSHFTHPLGQYQKWPHQLIAQERCQYHRAKYRQEQRQGQGTDVHAAQAVARQGTLLVFTVGFLHLDGIGHQRRR
ncbi:hypothetical protein D3C72_1152150 [compost metagenome]